MWQVFLIVKSLQPLDHLSCPPLNLFWLCYIPFEVQWQKCIQYSRCTCTVDFCKSIYNIGIPFSILLIVPNMLLAFSTEMDIYSQLFTISPRSLSSSITANSDPSSWYKDFWHQCSLLLHLLMSNDIWHFDAHFSNGVFAVPYYFYHSEQWNVISQFDYSTSLTQFQIIYKCLDINAPILGRLHKFHPLWARSIYSFSLLSIH